VIQALKNQNMHTTLTFAVAVCVAATLLSGCESSYKGALEISQNLSGVISVGNCKEGMATLDCTIKNQTSFPLDSDRVLIEISCYTSDNVKVSITRRVDSIEPNGAVRQIVCPANHSVKRIAFRA